MNNMTETRLPPNPPLQTGKVLQFGKPAAVTPLPPQPDTEPQEKNFDFYFTDGTVYQGTGFLIATSAFMGLGRANGEILFLVPLTNLSYVEATSEDVEATLPDAQTD